jgi:uncharacterized phage protein (TIGR02220 family)
MGFIIIPDAIKSMQKLNPNAKLLYGDILSLSAQNGYCFASNEYLSKIYGITTRSISNLISQLYEFGVIDIKNNSGQYGKVRTIFPIIQADHEQTFLSPRTNVPRTNVLPTTNERSDNIEQTFHEHRTNVPIPTNERSTIIDNIKDNRIDKLIDNDNKEESNFSLSEIKKEKESEPAENAKYYFEVTQVLELLTERSGVKFVIPKTKIGFEKYEPYKLIKDRINDGANLEDIFAVIEMKNTEWAGTHIYKNFVPSTLFRKSNFDKYLQQLQLTVKENQTNPNNQFKTKEDATFSHYFSQLRNVDYGFND